MFRFKLHHLLQLLYLVRFNTSYVSVQVKKYGYTYNNIISFNTSYVSVQVNIPNDIKELKMVSIHPMFRFKLTLSSLSLDNLCFNTSYVSVQVKN